MNATAHGSTTAAALNIVKTRIETSAVIRRSRELMSPGGAGALGPPLSTMGLIGLTGTALWVFRLARPWAPLSGVSGFWLDIAGLATGLGLTGGSMWFNWRFVFRRAPGLAMLNVLFSCLSFWLVGMWMLTWANLTFDPGPSRRVSAVVRECVYNSQSLRLGGHTAIEFRGLKVEFTESGLGPETLINRSALRADQLCPDVGTVVTLRLHPGRLGIPWVDDIEGPTAPALP